jgi:DNA-binding XRE family transcriptional regulator
VNAYEAAQKLKTRRLELGMRVDKACEEAGVCGHTLRDMENGRSMPKLDTFLDVCEALGLEVRLEPKENP